ncbi:hypothetical protein [Bradyrhizobium sp.]|uniref:hypothetical protein n=1 Tax=Bradyrhizobium sp. TaxID=376 RepID=UPI0025C31D01|nr:hypothetical protein [Bradyrhizobium sp.]
MGKIDKYVTFVKDHVAIQQKLAKKYEDTPYRKGQHLESAKGFADLADFLAEIQKKGTGDVSYLNRGDSPLKRLHLTFEDIQDLSEENLKELNITEAERQDLVVEHLIAQNGGIYSLDKIMVDLYRQTKEFPKRGTITSRLYRMVGKGMIYNVPGKKGVYSTFEMTEQEAKKLFGNFEGESEDAGATSEVTPSPPKPSQPQPSRSGLATSKYLNSTATPARRI